MSRTETSAVVGHAGDRGGGAVITRTTLILGLALTSLNITQWRVLRSALHDPLTGLATRRLWSSRAERAVRRPRGLVVLLIDGDGIKQVNDKYGHSAGDIAITLLAHRLRSWTGKKGMAGRLSGDEFVAFRRLPEGQCLENLLDLLPPLLSGPVPYCGEMLPVGASIGVVAVDGMPEPTLSKVMRAADEAMYQAKKAGGGQWRLADLATKGSD